MHRSILERLLPSTKAMLILFCFPVYANLTNSGFVFFYYIFYQFIRLRHLLYWSVYLWISFLLSILDL